METWNEIIEGSNRITMGIRESLEEMKRQEMEYVIKLTKKIRDDLITFCTSQEATPETITDVIKSEFTTLCSEIERLK